MPKVLLVEEIEFVIDILKKKLEKEGYEVVVARDKQEGLIKLKKSWPNLVLIDVDTVQGGGLEIVEEINRNPELKGVSVFIMVDSDQSLYIQKAIALGAREWLVKTEFEPSELVSKIEQTIGR